MNDPAPPTQEIITLWIPAVEPVEIGLTTTQVCSLFSVSRGQWTGWVSRGLAPKPDQALESKPLWRLTTLINYARNAPGGRLGYTVD